MSASGAKRDHTAALREHNDILKDITKAVKSENNNNPPPTTTS